MTSCLPDSRSTETLNWVSGSVPCPPLLICFLACSSMGNVWTRRQMRLFSPFFSTVQSILKLLIPALGSVQRQGENIFEWLCFKKYIIFGLFCSPMQFNARGEHMAQRGCFPLYNSHILYHMWGIISCYGMYNLSHVYSSIRQDGQCTVCLSAPETLSLW